MDQTTLKSFAGIAMSVRCGKNHTHDWYSYARKSPTVDAVTPAKSLCPAITYFILRASITCGCTRRACQYSYSGKHGLNTDKALILSNLNSLCTVFIMIWNVSLVCKFMKCLNVCYILFYTSEQQQQENLCFPYVHCIKVIHWMLVFLCF